MTRKQYIAAGIAGAALFALIYIVPALAEQRDLTPSFILGVVCLVVMAGCVLFGDLQEITPEEEYNERNLP